MSIVNWLMTPAVHTVKGLCLDWPAQLAGLHALCDGAIGIGCLFIAAALAALARQRSDMTRRWALYLFVAFSAVLGLAHIGSMAALWAPGSALAPAVWTVAALLTIAAALTLWREMPNLLSLPSRAQVAQTNLKLSATIAEQRHTAALLKKSEARTRSANLELEYRVAEQTAELRAANAQLTGALAERDSIMQALVSTEAEFRASFEAAAVGKVQCDAESQRILRVNPAFAHMLGLEPEDMVGRSVWDFVWPDDRQHGQTDYEAMRASHIGAYVRERRYVHRDGHAHWARVSVSLVRPRDDRHADMMVAVIEDIDEQRRALQAVAESRLALTDANSRLTEALAERSFALHTLTISEEEFRASFEDSVVGKLQVDLETTRIVRANRALARMIGYAPEELVGLHPRDFTAPEDLDEDARQYARFISGESPAYIREKRFICKDGQVLWVRVSGAVGQSIAYGRSKMMVAEIEDIDEAYRANESLQAAALQLETANGLLAAALAQRDSVVQALAGSEEAFRNSFEWAAVGNVQADPYSARILRTNAAFASLLGYEPEELVGRPGWDLIWPEDAVRTKVEYARLLAGEISGYVEEKRYLRKDGQPIWGRVSVSLARDPASGEPTLLISVVENIDAEHRSRLALEFAKQELEAVVEQRTTALTQRDMLLREVYHRVKNNLQIIDSFLVMQARHLTDPVARAALLNLRRRVFALGLVHHQLMGSQNLRTFDVAPFMRELSHNILEGGGERGVTLSVQAPPMDVGLDFAIPLGLLVTELVTNALKHAFPNGAGNISVVLERGDDGGVSLIVSDDGQSPGKGDIHAIRPTTGLGTSIIAGLVAQLKGTLTMASETGDRATGTRAEIRVAAPVLS